MIRTRASKGIEEGGGLVQHISFVCLNGNMKGVWMVEKNEEMNKNVKIISHLFSKYSVEVVVDPNREKLQVQRIA